MSGDMLNEVIVISSDLEAETSNNSTAEPGFESWLADHGFVFPSLGESSGEGNDSGSSVSEAFMAEVDETGVLSRSGGDFCSGGSSIRFDRFFRSDGLTDSASLDFDGYPRIKYPYDGLLEHYDHTILDGDTLD